MRIPPREHDKLLLHELGSLAQKRLARGLKLNHTEATALIASQLQEFIRDGKHSVDELMELGKRVLGRRHVLPSVPALLYEIQVEGTFPDGVFLVTVHNPICSDSGDLNIALYGSFLPIPTEDMFPLEDPALYANSAAPGAVVVRRERIEINKGRDRIRLKVVNKGDRPIQVGSHYNFSETNRVLDFDRLKASGRRLDIPAGTAIRFEPGDAKYVNLVEIGGEKKTKGGSGYTSIIEQARFLSSEDFARKMAACGIAHTPEPNALSIAEPYSMTRETYAGMFGPTTGDRVRLGDTCLWVEVEYDLIANPWRGQSGDRSTYGDECKFGGGKVLREAMGQACSDITFNDEDSTCEKCGHKHAECQSCGPKYEVLDLLITNALIIDWSGIFKADIGIRKGKIVGIGKAGNPDIMDGVGFVAGTSTEVIAGEKLIVTAGAIDAHVHYICPQQWQEAMASGTTTMIGGGTGPSAGTNATTCTPSPFYMQHMLAATDSIPMNFLFTGKGNDSCPAALETIVKAGAAGLKLHEDWGTTPSAIKCCLDVGDKYDVQVNIHTDTLNESGFVEDTIAAFGGRTIHTYHTEGAGGGHAPDIIVVCGQDNVLPSSTNPTRPFAINTVSEHHDMLMVCHHLDKSIHEDCAFADSRIRKETIAAEDVLHDLGAISMISSDSQAMGRVGEVISRTWRTAAKMRELRGPSVEDGDKEGMDNVRVKRYISKYTINPAITHGIGHLVGQVKEGCLADLVLWRPENFGAKPEMVLKSGVIAWAQMGDANASIPTVQPVYSRPMWGAHPSSAALNSVAFVSEISITSGAIEKYGLSKKPEAVKGCRKVRKTDMKWNNTIPKMSVDPETYAVHADGILADVPPAETLPLTRAYNVLGIVAQAALDVFSEEPPAKDSLLVQHQNVIVTPHLGASTVEAQEGVAIEIAEAVVGALQGELAATAVNAPMVPAEVLSELAPYVVLAEKLGRLAVQLVAGGSGIKGVKIVYASARDPDDLDTRILRATVTKGIIEPISSVFVNIVNADYTAKQRGLRISEERYFHDGSADAPVDSIQVHLTNVESKFASATSDSGEIRVEGRVKDGIPHLTLVGSFEVDVSLEGNLILCKQIDQPGMIGLVGNILGESNVNVNFMSVGRTGLRQQAIMAIGVDEEPEKETLKKIGEVPAIEEFVFLKL